ncbi:hypothetical protein L21SP3_00054 [Sedimentisphaera cyanobacteriorum]|uniref:PEP-CTERM protein-sorting domain-containing protein n=1 Tax=Sedimentisphaera cyanobacteriorum TaxID=1940790 RepID=A0A1Q2HLD9_9BACT|nr:PEP-CTERM sorting domain-containing protein [Sedimentisphaera cyanobacteriorum]AQQ08278.1 hypothetical protein L21SP3_00054 [Sedimentisphaera cyanobacteriorum]
MRSMLLAVCGLAVALVCSYSYSAYEQIDLDQFDNGQELTDQLSGITFSADNTGGGPDSVAIFDTTLTGTADPDLEGPPNTDWEGGNLSDLQTSVGNIIIIQENTDGYDPGNGDTIFDNPDDEGGGGSIFIDYGSTLMKGFKFAFADSEEYSSGDSVCVGISFYRDSFSDNDLVAEVPLANYLEQGNYFKDTYNSDNSIEFEDHYANEFEITSGDLEDAFTGVADGTFNKIKICLDNSSGGFGMLEYERVPEPVTFALLGSGLVMIGRKKRSE